MAEKKTIEQLEADYKRLTSDRDTLVANKMKLEAELGTRKRQLAELLEEFKAKHPDKNPNNLAEDIRHLEEVLALKLSNFDAELSAVRDQMAPMMKELG